MTFQPNPDNTGWMEHAACKGRTSEFFVQRGDTNAVLKAKAICNTCPVLEPCRDYVIYNPEIFGIWGAMTERDRRTYRAEHGIELSNFAHGTVGKYESGCRCFDCRNASRLHRSSSRR